ncbi:protein convertase [Bifidobacterium dentium]|nr:protein convertase [Bifidobacterium dentium]NEG52996.1 protein convertase [Bifidobacterium dentium]
MPEAAALCGLTEKTIRQAVRRGDLIACYAYTSTVRIRRRGFG